MINLHDFVYDTIASMIGRESEEVIRQYINIYTQKEILTESDVAALEELEELRVVEITEGDVIIDTPDDVIEETETTNE